MAETAIIIMSMHSVAQSLTRPFRGHPLPQAGEGEGGPP